MPFAPCTSTTVKFHPWSKTISDSFSSCLHLRVPQWRNQVSYPSPHTHTVSHHAFKNQVYNKTKRTSRSPSGATYLIAWGKWLQHVPQIRSCLFPGSHSSEPVLSAFPLHSSFQTPEEGMYLFLFTLTCLSVF